MQKDHSGDILAVGLGNLGGSIQSKVTGWGGKTQVQHYCDLVLSVIGASIEQSKNLKSGCLLKTLSGGVPWRGELLANQH